MAVSFQCMTKIHYNIKNKNKKFKKNKNKIKKEKKEPTYVEGCTQSSWSLSLNSEKIGGNWDPISVCVFSYTPNPVFQTEPGKSFVSMLADWMDAGTVELAFWFGDDKWIFTFKSLNVFPKFHITASEWSVCVQALYWKLV